MVQIQQNNQLEDNQPSKNLLYYLFGITSGVAKVEGKYGSCATETDNSKDLQDGLINSDDQLKGNMSCYHLYVL